MQVKKFEARSMNEALEMVKRELGPDAIILSAKDNRKRFGLVGDGSVEITAAVAEATLQKKRYAEAKMKPETKERFLNSPARTQRQIMNNFVDSYHAESAADRNKSVGNRRYIDIEDDHGYGAQEEVGSVRVRDAAQRAWDALRSSEGGQFMTTASAPASAAVGGAAKAAVAKPAIGVGPAVTPAVAGAPVSVAQESSDYAALKSELESLKSVLRDFQKVPQSFVQSATGQHPGSVYGLSYDFSSSFEKLVRAGVKEDLAGEILLKAQDQLPRIKHKSRGLIDGFAAKYILDSTKVLENKKNERIHCFVGPRGSGKTSALVKMASHAVVSGQKKVAILTTDTFKVGAVDQMRIFAQILNVPFGVIKKPSDWRTLLDQLSGYDLILVDFPGLSLKTVDEHTQLKALLLPGQAAAVHLTLSACAKDADLEEAGKRYEASKYSDLIFNHLDEALGHGCIYNIMRQFDRPLHSFGVGPKVPEDFETATKERVLDLIFKLSKLKRAE